MMPSLLVLEHSTTSQLQPIFVLLTHPTVASVLPTLCSANITACRALDYMLFMELAAAALAL